MEKFELKNFKNGWFIGDFEPTLLKTFYFEAGIKEYSAGDVDKKHFHNLVMEYTVIISGKAMMNDVECNEGEIILVKSK